MAGKTDSEIEQELFAAVAASRGHFVYESGHHGDLWLEFDRLFFETEHAHRFVAMLGERTHSLRPDTICGPLVGGAFVAHTLAAQTHRRFAFSEPRMQPDGTAEYVIPPGLQSRLANARVLVVDDVMNAGSAVRMTADALRKCGATLVGFGALMALGNVGPLLREEYGVPFTALSVTERRLWEPHLCVLCEHGVPITDDQDAVTGLLSDSELGPRRIR